MLLVSYKIPCRLALMTKYAQLHSDKQSRSTISKENEVLDFVVKNIKYVK